MRLIFDIFIILLLIAYIDYVNSVPDSRKEFLNIGKIIFEENGTKEISSNEIRDLIIKGQEKYQQIFQPTINEIIIQQDLDKLSEFYRNFNVCNNQALRYLKELKDQFGNGTYKNLIDYLKNISTSLDSLCRVNMNFHLSTQPPNGKNEWIMLRKKITNIIGQPITNWIEDMSDISRDVIIEGFQLTLNDYGTGRKPKSILWSNFARFNEETAILLRRNICSFVNYFDYINEYRQAFPDTNYFKMLNNRLRDNLLRRLICAHLNHFSTESLIKANIARNFPIKDLYRSIFEDGSNLRSEETNLLLKVISSQSEISSNQLEDRRSSMIIDIAKLIMFSPDCEYDEIKRLTKIEASNLSPNLRKYYDENFVKYLIACAHSLNRESDRTLDFFGTDLGPISFKLDSSRNFNWQPNSIIETSEIQRNLVEYASENWIHFEDSSSEIFLDRIRFRLEILVQTCSMFIYDFSIINLFYLHINAGFGLKWFQSMIDSLSLESRYVLIGKRLCDSLINGDIESDSIVAIIVNDLGIK